MIHDSSTLGSFVILPQIQMTAIDTCPKPFLAAQRTIRRAVRLGRLLAPCFLCAAILCLACHLHQLLGFCFLHCCCISPWSDWAVRFVCSIVVLQPNRSCHHRHEGQHCKHPCYILLAHPQRLSHSPFWCQPSTFLFIPRICFKHRF